MTDTPTDQQVASLLDTLRKEFAPEAKEYTELLMNDKIPATQDNYGKLMGFLSMFPNNTMKGAFVLAMIDAGYPKRTAEQVLSLTGVIS